MVSNYVKKGYISSPVKKQYDAGTCGMATMENGLLVPDDFRHEQYLLIEEQGKKISILEGENQALKEEISQIQVSIASLVSAISEK